MTRMGRRRNGCSYLALRKRTRALEPLEDRRLLAVLDRAWDYNAVDSEWFASVATSTATEIGAAPQSTEWIVRLGEECLSAASKPGNVTALLGGGGSVRFKVLKGLGLPGQLLVSSASDTAAIEAALRANPTVASYAANAIVRAADIPNDERFSELIGLHNTGQLPGAPSPYPDINAPEAWETQTGSRNVIVAVLDSGIDVNHPDLVNNLWTNQFEQFGQPGVDDDGNGCVDDVHGCSWIDMVTVDDRDMPTGNVADGTGHGTHVAGTIGAEGNNGQGVTGVAREVSLLPLKVLRDDNTGTLANVGAAINWAAGYAAKLRDSSPDGPQLRVINASLGSYSRDEALQDTIRAAGANGILVVAAAGNGVDGVSGVDTDATPFYPAAYELDNIISVAAVNNYDTPLKLSNFGLHSVDVAAPGAGVLSTVPDGGYDYRSGTSMAAPLVSGVAALLWSQYSYGTVEEVREAILRSGDSLAVLQDRSSTGKRLNAAGALAIDTARPHVEFLPIPDVRDADADVEIRILVRDNQSLSRNLLELSSLEVRRLGSTQSTKVRAVDAIPYDDGDARPDNTYLVTYRLDPAGGDGRWGEDDSGRYRVTLPSDSVLDSSANFAVGGILGSFDVSVDEADVLSVGDTKDEVQNNLKLSLREAIIEANRISGPNRPITILLPDRDPLSPLPSIYQLEIDGKGENASRQGDLDILGNITIVGAGFDRSIIDGGALDRVFHVHTGATLRLSGVTVRDGRAPTTSDRDGGGIHNRGTLELDGVVIRENEARLGAGLYNEAGAKATIRATSFVENRATASGGGVYNATVAGGQRPELETLLALGDEQPVNAVTAAIQQFPAVAMDAEGNSLVVWESFDGLDAGRIYAQLLDKSGAKVGGQFPVSITGPQRVHPTVAMAADGSATVAWQGFGADGNGTRIHVRRRDKNGNWSPTEQVPYDYMEGHQSAPHVSLSVPDGEGRHAELILWSGNGPQDAGGVYSDDSGVFARYQSREGNPITLRANVTSEGNQWGGIGAIAASGQALIVWNSAASDGSSAIVARRLNALGVPLGGEILLARSTTEKLTADSLIATPGGFVVAWTESSADESTSRVLYCRLNALGLSVEAARPLSDSASERERGAALAALPDGGFAAAFASFGRDGDDWDVYVRQFDAAGEPRSGAFAANTTASGNQLNPRLAANASGRIAVAWNGAGQHDAFGIVFRRYEAAFNEASVIASASVYLENVTLSGNEARTNGSAVLNAAGAVTALVHATVYGNVVMTATGGAVAAAGDGTLALKSTLLAANRLGANPGSDLDGHLTSLGYNLAANLGDSTGYGRGGDLDPVDAGPFLDELPSDAQAPQVHKLRPDNPAIDRGDALRAPPRDQLGSPRPQDGNDDGTSLPDIGAVERYFGEIAGIRYYDKNGNGRRDAEDSPIVGQVVYLDTHNFGVRDDDEPTAITNADGEYFFNNVPPGRHSVAIDEQQGWQLTSPPPQVPSEQSPPSSDRQIIDHLTIDVDGDQDLDLVALEGDPLGDVDSILVSLNDGEGSFSSPWRTFPSGASFATALAAGDINGDFKVDMVIAQSGSAAPIYWLPNLGGGAFGVPQVAVASARAPQVLFVGMLDQDEFPDLAWLSHSAVQENTTALTVALNVGGEFPASTTHELGARADRITLGDLNGDGFVDLIAGNRFLPNDGLGQGRFAEVLPVAAQNPSLIQAAADLDGDGDADYLGFQALTRELRVLRNQGGLGLNVEAPIDLEGIPKQLQLADVDHDGDQDVAVLTDDPRSVRFLINEKGNLRLAQGALPFDAGIEALNFHLDDLDGDGYPDVSATIDSGADSRVALFRNTRGANRLELHAGQAAAGVDFAEQALTGEISGFVFIDLDRDGYYDFPTESPIPVSQVVDVQLEISPGTTLHTRPDASGRYVFSNLNPTLNDSTRYKLRLNTEPGWVAGLSPTEYSIALPAAAAVTDRNFGRYQIVVHGSGIDGRISGKVQLDQNGVQTPLNGVPVYVDYNDSGTIETGEPIATTNGNGDYTITGVRAGDHAVRVLAPDKSTDDPRGNTFSALATGVGKAPQAVALIDFDSDGDLDVATPNMESDNITILRNNGGVMEKLTSPLDDGQGATGPSSIVVADLDGRNGLDIAVTNLDTKNVTIYLSHWSGPNNSVKWFARGGVFPAGPSPTAIVAGDWNRDGRVDLAVVSERNENFQNQGSVQILRNDPNAPTGTVRFTSAERINVGLSPRAVAAADLDADGWLDLAVANFDSHTVSVLRGLNGAFAPSRVTTVPTGLGPSSVVIADIDQDPNGDLDLIIGNYFSSSVTVRYNDGNAGFAVTNSFPLLLSPTSLALGDIDGDGDQDVIAGLRTIDGTDMGVSLLRNRHRQGQPFAPAEKIGVGSGLLPYSRHLSVAAGRLNGDDRVDFVVSDGVENVVRAVLNGPAQGAHRVALSSDAHVQGFNFVLRSSAASDPPPTLDEIVPPAAVPEDTTALTSVPLSGISAGIGQAGQAIELRVDSDDPSFFDDLNVTQTSPTGAVTFRPAANRFGSRNVTVTVMDAGPDNNLATEADNGFALETFTVTVLGVNDPPTFTPGPNVAVLANSGANTVPRWATNISPGADNEHESVTFFISDTTGAGLFAPATDTLPGGLPRILSDGTLTFRVREGAFGRATVTVNIYDGQFSTSRQLRIDVVRPGDTDFDGRVDLDDLNAVRNNFGAGAEGGPRVPGDANLDGVVDLDDLNAVRNNFGAGAAPIGGPPSFASATDAVFHALGDDAADALKTRERRAGQRWLAK